MIESGWTNCGRGKENNREGKGGGGVVGRRASVGGVLKEHQVNIGNFVMEEEKHGGVGTVRTVGDSAAKILESDSTTVSLTNNNKSEILSTSKTEDK